MTGMDCSLKHDNEALARALELAESRDPQPLDLLRMVRKLTGILEWRVERRMQTSDVCVVLRALLELLPPPEKKS